MSQMQDNLRLKNYTALLVYRLLEAKLDGQGTHVTVNDLIITQKNMNAPNVHDMEYRVFYNESMALDVLMRLTMLPLNRLH